MNENKTKVPDGFKKVVDTIFKFESEGESVQGCLVAVEDGTKFGNKAYKIQTKESGVITVFGTSILESLMASVPLGKEVVIVYTGSKPDKNGNKARKDTKLFEVFVK